MCRPSMRTELHQHREILQPRVYSCLVLADVTVAALNLHVAHSKLLPCNANDSLAPPLASSHSGARRQYRKDLWCRTETRSELCPPEVWNVEMFRRVERDPLGLC